MSQKYFIKIKNQQIKFNELNDKRYLCYSFLKFNSNNYGRVNCTLTEMCDIMHYSTSSKNTKSNSQNSFKNEISKLIDEKVLYFIPNTSVKTFESLTSSKMFTLMFNPEEEELLGNYTILGESEFLKIVQLSKVEKIEAHKLMNVYLLIKSYLYNGKNKLTTVCYASVSHLAGLLNCDKRTVRIIIDILIKNKMIYSYLINNDKDKYLYLDNNKNIVGEVFSTNIYDIEDVKLNFAKIKK